MINKIKFKVFTGGSKCSASGKKYEKEVNAICRSVQAHGSAHPLSTMDDKDLGGCTSRFDLQLNWGGGARNVNVEIKRNTPDWVQTSIVPSTTQRRSPRISIIQWRVKAASPFSHIFDGILAGKHVFDDVPSFACEGKNRNSADWEKERALFPDKYIECHDNCIADAYRVKGVEYIQVFGYGLYHTGNDSCNLGVPMFLCKQKLRIRCKRHGKRCKDTGKYVPSSITASLRPVLKTLQPSGLSLDNCDSLMNSGVFMRC
jgi:hypothetical protein